MDNAANNDKMLQELPLLLPADATVGTTYQVRCFAHIHVPAPNHSVGAGLVERAQVLG